MFGRNRLHFEVIVGIIICMFTVLNLVPVIIQEISRKFEEEDNNRPSLRVIEVQGTLIACIAATFPIIFDMLLDYLRNKQLISVYEYVPKREMFVAVIIPDLLFLLLLIPYDKYSFVTCLYNVRDTLIIWGFLLHLWKLQPDTFHTASCGLIGICLSSANILDSYTNNIENESIVISVKCITYAIVFLSILEICRKIIQFGTRIRTHFLSSSKSISSKEFMSCVYLGCFILYVICDWIALIIPSIYYSEYWNTSGPYYFILTSVVNFMCIIVIMVFATRTARYDMLNREKDLKSMLVGYFSHEIRTPLNTVEIGVQVVRRALMSLYPQNHIHKMIETVTEIELSCDAAIAILEDLLLYEQLEHGVEGLNKSNFPLVSFLDDRIHSVQSLATSKNIILKCEYSRSKMYDWSRIIINGDEMKFNRMLTRLLSNAIQTSQINTEVLIDVEVQQQGYQTTASASSSSSLSSSPLSPASQRPVAYNNQKIHTEATGPCVVLIHITDNGSTISPDDIVKMFSDGISFTTGVLKASEGLGLSLWIVRKLMILHGGDLSFRPAAQSNGSTFTLSIPAIIQSNSRPPINVFRRISKSMQFEFRKSRMSFAAMSQSSSVATPDPSGVWSLKAIRASMFAGSFSETNSNGDNRRNAYVDGKPVKPSILPEQNNGSRSASILRGNKDNESIQGMSGESSGSPRKRLSSNEENKLDVVREFESSIYSVNHDEDTPKVMSESFDQLEDTPGDNTPMRRRASQSTQIHTEVAQNHYHDNPTVRRKILVVDDAIMNRKMMCRLLADYCDEVVTADDGVQAIEEFKQSSKMNLPFSLILMDYQMPNMDGPTATKAIRELGFNGPIIGVTGNTMQHQIDTFLQCGADRILHKPLHFSKLIQALSDMELSHILISHIL